MEELGLIYLDYVQIYCKYCLKCLIIEQIEDPEIEFPTIQVYYSPLDEIQQNA